MVDSHSQAIERFVIGIPYARSKSKGKLLAPKIWTAAIMEQTADLPRIRGACELDVEFVLPPNKFPADFPYGMDLDNLLKRLLDGLGMTIFSQAHGKDSVVVSIRARKRGASPGEDSGAKLKLTLVDWNLSFGLPSEEIL